MTDERNQSLAKEPLFRIALDAATDMEDRAYLGNKEVVETVLRIAAQEVFSAFPQLSPGDSLGQLAYNVGRKWMRVFLGRVPEYRGIRGFHKMGSVDTFVAKWCGVDARTPTDRLAGAFVNMVNELMDLEVYANTGVPEEQWKWQVDEVITRYAYILIGVPPPEQALMGV